MTAETPHYPHARIQSVASLGLALGESENHLSEIIGRIPCLYIGPTSKPKKNGTGFRDVYDTKRPLKPLLKRINKTFFKKVTFPQYLTGSLAGTDYIANVEIHSNAKVVITEDIASFFDCITAQHVFDIWRGFFRFGDDAADVLTALTTKDGRVFQGTPTSSYLANLAFWSVEGRVVQRLLEKGIRYSRYVDDITVSSKTSLSRTQMAWAISQIYGMVEGRDFKPKRGKHKIYTSGSAISLMGLNANQKASLTSQEKSNIRAAVFQLERRVESGEATDIALGLLRKVTGRVTRLRRLHPNEGGQLSERITRLSQAVSLHHEKKQPL